MASLSGRLCRAPVKSRNRAFPLRIKAMAKKGYSSAAWQHGHRSWREVACIRLCVPGDLLPHDCECRGAIARPAMAAKTPRNTRPDRSVGFQHETDSLLLLVPFQPGQAGTNLVLTHIPTPSAKPAARLGKISDAQGLAPFSQTQRLQAVTNEFASTCQAGHLAWRAVARIQHGGDPRLSRRCSQSARSRP